MIINFLQVRDPPIVPSLQKIPENRSVHANGESSAFADDVEKLRGYGKDNTESLGQLLFSFFRHYGYIVDYSASVVSVKEGRLVPRKEKGWDAANWGANKEARSSLCVEEPFNTPRNLGNSADDYAWNGIHKEIRRAFELIRDGENLDKCCEMYEFPPEEKSSTLFQRPTPKPTVLRRTHSQKGIQNSPAQGRALNNVRNGRNPSAQRNNNRRASSGANFTNNRVPYVMASPPINVNPADYFSPPRMSTDQLHDQLYKQYQYLQAQQEALRNQLLQQQQQQQNQVHMHAQAQVQAAQVIGAASPRQHRQSFNNAISSPQSPRMVDNAPNTAPLLPPGSLYHYPARYPPPSPLVQSRTTDEAVTSPSSPSLANAATSSRRGVHRGSITEGSSGPRSQSQPGRSFPNSLTLQGLVHPGYDISGALGTPYLVTRQMHAYSQLQANGTIRQTNGVMYADTAMPKEYVGYYVGSPQLLPQYQTNNMPQVPSLQNTPARSISARRISPELVPPSLPNGLRYPSRSPSPLGRDPNHSSSNNTRSGSISQGQFQQAIPPPRPVEDRGPVIVNGSGAGYVSSGSSISGPTMTSSSWTAVQNGVEVALDTTPTEQVRQLSLETPSPYTNGTTQHQQQHPRNQPSETARGSNGYRPDQMSNKQITPRQSWSDSYESHDSKSGMSLAAQGERIARARNMPPLNLSPPDGDRKSNSDHSASPLASAGPVLSPVEEARTPSPTVSRGPDYIRSGPHRKLAHAAQVANGKLAGEQHGQGKKENHTPRNNGSSSHGSGHGGENSKSQQSSSNAWQPAPSRKGHKKSKSSSAGGRASHTSRSGGEPMPANEADRKGG